MKKTYFLIPLLLTLIFGGGYVMQRQSVSAAEAQARQDAIAAKAAAKKARAEEQEKVQKESARQLAEFQAAKAAKEKLATDRKAEIAALEAAVRTAEAARNELAARKTEAEKELAAESGLSEKTAEQLRQFLDEGQHLKTHAERITANDRRLTELMERLNTPAPAPATVSPATPAVAAN